MREVEHERAVRQMRNVVLIIGLAWLCVGVPLLIGVASVGGNAWTTSPALLAVVGCALAIAGAIGTWLMLRWGPVVHVIGAVLIIAKSFAYVSVSSPFTMPWGFLFVLFIFIAVVAPNWPAFRSR